MEKIKEEPIMEQGFIFAAHHDMGTFLRAASLWVLSVTLFFSALLFPLSILNLIPNVNNEIVQLFSISMVLLCLGGVMSLALSIEAAETRFLLFEKERFYEWVEERYQVGFEQKEAEALYLMKTVIRTVNTSKSLYAIRKDEASGFYYLFHENEVALKQSLKEKKANDKKLEEMKGFVTEVIPKLKPNHTPKLPSTPPPKPSSVAMEKDNIKPSPYIGKTLVKIPSLKTKTVVKVTRTKGSKTSNSK